jgi:hypothetical protein
MNRTYASVTAILLAAVLAGCGGGGEDDGARATGSTIALLPAGWTLTGDVEDGATTQNFVPFNVNLKDGGGVPIGGVKVQIFWAPVLDADGDPVATFPYEPTTDAFGNVKFYAGVNVGDGVVLTATVDVFSGVAHGSGALTVTCFDSIPANVEECPS